MGNIAILQPSPITHRVSFFSAKPLNQHAKNAVKAFERNFRERGLPQAIRSDNGVPFASPNSLFNLSKLAVKKKQPGHRG